MDASSPSLGLRLPKWEENRTDGLWQPGLPYMALREQK